MNGIISSLSLGYKTQMRTFASQFDSTTNMNKILVLVGIVGVCVGQAPSSRYLPASSRSGYQQSGNGYSSGALGRSSQNGYGGIQSNAISRGGYSSAGRSSQYNGARTISSLGNQNQGYGNAAASYAGGNNGYQSGYAGGNNGYQGGNQYGRQGANDNSEPARYEFKYDVNDPEYGVEFGHEEQRDGDNTSGAYYVLLPDGRRQLVEYTADLDGYHPRISYTEAAGGRSGNGNYQGAGNYQSGGYSQNGGGYQSGGYQSGRSGNGGYQSGRSGNGGYQSGRSGNGGYQSGRSGNGGYQSGRSGNGGYQSGSSRNGGYQSGSSNGGY